MMIEWIEEILLAIILFNLFLERLIINMLALIYYYFVSNERKHETRNKI